VGGQYTVLDRAALRCRLDAPDLAGAATGAQRAELAANRELHWDPAYQMPDYAQVLVASRRWNVQTRGASPVPAPDGTALYWRAVVVQV
jgi:hypothetical protein